MTQMLFTKRYFIEDDFYNNKHEEFNDFMTKLMHLGGTFNISDFVPYLKPFDLQGLIPQAREICMEMDQFFDKIIHDHMNEKHADGSKDLVDVLLSLPPMEDSGDKLDDNKIKAMLIVMFTLPHVDCNFKSLKTYLHIKEMNLFAY
jgi:cytochrome P450